MVKLFIAILILPIQRFEEFDYRLLNQYIFVVTSGHSVPNCFIRMDRSDRIPIVRDYYGYIRVSRSILSHHG